MNKSDAQVLKDIRRFLREQFIKGHEVVQEGVVPHLMFTAETLQGVETLLDEHGVTHDDA